MPDSEWDERLAAAAGQVLETMFFTAIHGPAEAAGSIAAARVAAHLTFAGTTCGALTVSVSESSVRALAANFLAMEQEDPIPASQIGCIVCELTNMICGSLLSRVKTEQHIRLSSPELWPEDAALPAEPPSQSLDLGDGTIDLWLAVEEHAG
jgi:CheY-specific phosphatase CheX